MRRILGRILSALLTAGGWLLAGARTTLDLIGYSTAPEDIEVAQLAWISSSNGFFRCHGGSFGGLPWYLHCG